MPCLTGRPRTVAENRSQSGTIVAYRDRGWETPPPLVPERRRAGDHGNHERHEEGERDPDEATRVQVAPDDGIAVVDGNQDGAHE